MMPVDEIQKSRYHEAVKLKFMPGKEIPLDTPLWRYMKLSTFLLLLKENRVFIPTLKSLRTGDPKEMWLRRHSVMSIADPFTSSAEFQNARQWLKDKLRSRTGLDLDRFTSDVNLQDINLTDEWIEQLSLRRCAWCWFNPTAPGLESMAMWSFYAPSGIAIQTTLGRIQAAIHEPDMEELLVAPMEYSVQGRRNSLFQDADYSKRPFLFKSASYLHEVEIRLVFRVDPSAVESGFEMNVDAKKLLEAGEIVISPFVHSDEARTLREISSDLLPGVAVKIRHSSEQSPTPFDPSTATTWDLDKVFPPLAEEDGLPDVLREL